MYKPKQKEKGMLLVPYRYAIEMVMVIKMLLFHKIIICILMKTKNYLKQIKKTNKELNFTNRESNLTKDMDAIFQTSIIKGYSLLVYLCTSVYALQRQLKILKFLSYIVSVALYRQSSPSLPLDFIFSKAESNLLYQCIS